MMGMGRGEGIHPRVFWPDGVKKNTCKPKSKARLERVANAIAAHLENHPHDEMSAARLSNLKRQIGEMR